MNNQVCPEYICIGDTWKKEDILVTEIQLPTKVYLEKKGEKDRGSIEDYEDIFQIK